MTTNCETMKTREMEEEECLVVAVPGAEESHADDEAENDMMRKGLAKSQQFSPDSPSLGQSWGKTSVCYASASDLLGLAEPGQVEEEENEIAEVTPLKQSAYVALPKEVCLQAKTVLMLSFCFYQAEDKESPSFLARALLTRELSMDGGPAVALWEPEGLPKEVAELSLHFRELLGVDQHGTPTVQRLRMTDKARTVLFGDARLWADTRTGFAGRQCEWTDVNVQIFNHGAVLSVAVNWMSGTDSAAFSLADLRTWVYVSKFRQVKVGVTRGWSFAQHVAGEDQAKKAQESLGLKLFAALYGGSCVSLSSIANWLVMLPWDKTSKIPRYVSRTDYCQHHTFASLLDASPPPPKDMDTYCFHIRKQYGSNFRRPVPDDKYAALYVPDETWKVRRNCVLSMAAGGAVAVEWGGTSPARSFATQFFGLFLVLKRHCLSERVALEKLSFLAALHSQGLSRSSFGSVAESQKVRFELMTLTSLLVHYRTAMASDDCGGGAEARKQFKLLRQVHGIEALKHNLFDQLQDVEYILSCELREEDQMERQKELTWMIFKEGIAQRKKALKDAPKTVFDVFFFAFSAVVFPIVLIATLFGSNQLDMPRQTPWKWLLVGAAVVSAVLLFVFMFIYVRQLPRLKAFEDARREHMLHAASIR